MNADSNLTFQLLSQRIIRKKRKHWKEANKGDNISEQISDTEKISKGNNTGLFGISIYTSQQHSKKTEVFKKNSNKIPFSAVYTIRKIVPMSIEPYKKKL